MSFALMFRHNPDTTAENPWIYGRKAKGMLPQLPITNTVSSPQIVYYYRGSLTADIADIAEVLQREATANPP